MLSEFLKPLSERPVKSRMSHYRENQVIFAGELEMVNRFILFGEVSQLSYVILCELELLRSV